MKRTISIALFLLMSFWIQAQEKAQIQGMVVDSLNTPLPGATVVLLQQSDSVLVNFSITDGKGNFSLPKVEIGPYVLQISYLGYANYSTPLVLASDTDLGKLKMRAKEAVLDEVLIKAEHIPMRIKKDTIEYNADAFKTRPNAAVEDLLRRLPGVEVARDGTVRAQGEVVQNVLVDGKSFFGDDPQIATKNLPADAVDKVQVFDKKSDLAEFSGIDDGQEQKTINLALKADKKAGYFGKVEAGYGTDQRFENRANINRFSGKMQMSALGMWNNVNKQGFSINDYINFMGGIQNLMSGGGSGGSLSLNSNDLGLPIDFGGNNGLVNTGAGGLNFNYDFSRSTQFRSSYFFNRIETVRARSLSRESFVEDSSFDFLESGQQRNRNLNHRANIRLEHEVDSFSNLIVQANLGLRNGRLFNDQFNETFNTAALLQNDSERNYRTQSQNFDLNTNLTYRRRFRTRGRVLVADLSFGAQQNDGTAELSALNRFYDASGNTISKVDTLIQDQLQQNDQLEYGASLSYTEPLGGGRYLGLSYRYQQLTNEIQKEFFYTFLGNRRFNSDLSNAFERDYHYHRTGLNFRLNRKKFNFTAAVNWQQSELKGVFQQMDNPIQKQFSNVLPSLFWDFKMDATRNINFRYQTSVREPSLEQLQPIVDNSDPLRIYSGNPDLRTAYAHDLSLRLMSFDQFTFVNLFATINARYTRNQITNARRIDNLFRQQIRPVNVKDDLLLNSSVSFGSPLRFIKSKVNINYENRYNRARIVINDLEEIGHLWTHTIDFSFENRKKKVVDFIVGTKWALNQNRYSESAHLNQAYLNQTYYLDLNIDLFRSWRLSTAFDYQIYSAENFGARQEIPIWKAELSKTAFKDRLEFRLSVFDLLNKNIGVDRRTAWNYVEEERVVSLGRYAMLSVVYSLSGFKGSSSGIEIQTSRRN
ncbi:MAG: TonB-dependent receptor [Bacteroidota bacterium]